MTSLITQPAWHTVITVDGERRSVVRECFRNVGGHWYCVTHQQHFPNNLSASSHENDGEPHEPVWLCDEHGPEGVPA